MIFDLKNWSVTKSSLMGIFRVLLGASALCLMAAALSGCGWMSVNGPAASDILSGQHDPVSLNYAVVKVTPKVIEVQSQKPAASGRLQGEPAAARHHFRHRGCSGRHDLRSRFRRPFHSCRRRGAPGKFCYHSQPGRRYPRQHLDPLRGCHPRQRTHPGRGAGRHRGRAQEPRDRAPGRCVHGRTEDLHDQHPGRRTLGADSGEQPPPNACSTSSAGLAW